MRFGSVLFCSTFVFFLSFHWIFQGVCGADTYVKKQEAIAANNFVFLWFTFLMRSYKIATILLFHSQTKQDEDDYVETHNNSSHNEQQRGSDADDEGCTKQKCRVWFILSQELTAIICVAFLLLVCLPVLAFWFMFCGVLVSSYNIIILLNRLWRDAHLQDYLGDDEISIMEEGQDDNAEDIEFKEFLVNFSEDEK